MICSSLHVGLELTWTLRRVSAFFYNVTIFPLFRWVSCCCPTFWCNTDRCDIQVSVFCTITEGRASCCERNIDMRFHPQQRESGKIDSKTNLTSTQGIAIHKSLTHALSSPIVGHTYVLPKKYRSSGLQVRSGRVKSDQVRSGLVVRPGQVRSGHVRSSQVR